MKINPALSSSSGCQPSGPWPLPSRTTLSAQRCSKGGMLCGAGPFSTLKLSELCFSLLPAASVHHSALLQETRAASWPASTLTFRFACTIREMFPFSKEENLYESCQQSIGDMTQGRRRLLNLIPADGRTITAIHTLHNTP